MIDATTMAVDGFWTAIVLIVPLALVGAGASASVSALGQYVGVSDPTLGRVARTFGVLLAVGLMLGSIGDRFVALAHDGLQSVAGVEAR